MTAFPKPQKRRKKKDPRAKAWMARVAALPCCVCKRPANIHHVRTKRHRDKNDFRVIPLCINCHQHGHISVHGTPFKFSLLHGESGFGLLATVHRMAKA